MTIRRLLVLTVLVVVAVAWCVESAQACCKKKKVCCTPPPPPAKAPPPPVKKAEAPAPAKIYVNLPAKARLFIDERATTSGDAQRMFYTPELDPEKTFILTLRAEIPHEGRIVSTVRRVRVRAGEDVTVDMEAPAAVAAK